jgi:ribonuclease P protein component
MTRHGFPKRVRLLRASDFERVFARRLSAGNAWFTVYGAANEFGHPRLGLVVSRRIGSAAARNRWKRLLREAFRLTQDRLPALDMLCVVRSQTPPTLAELMESLPTLVERIDAMQQPKSARQAST